MTFFEVIRSTDNPKFKSWSKLLNSKGIKKENSFILSGPKVVKEQLSKRPRQWTDLILPEDFDQELDSKLYGRLRVHRLAKELFDQLDSFGTRSPLLVGLVPEIKTLDLSTPPQGLELILPASDPSNLGAVLRSAAAFGVSKVILTEESAHPFHPKALRSSAGSSLDVEIYKTVSIEQVNSPNMFYLDMKGEELSETQVPQNARLLLGEEGLGVPESIKKQGQAVKISMSAGVDSLNLAVSAGIALYWLSRKE